MCLCTVSRRFFLALFLIITIRNDNGTWQIAGCAFWFWFSLSHHEYTKSCKTAIKDRAANHVLELCWIIHIDTVWAYHACCIWKRQTPICFQQIAMTVLLFVLVRVIRNNSHSSSELHQLTNHSLEFYSTYYIANPSSLFNQNRWLSVCIPV